MTTQVAKEDSLRNPRAPGLSLLGTVPVLKQSPLALEPGMAGHRLEERACHRERDRGRGTENDPGPGEGAPPWTDREVRRTGDCLVRTVPRLREAQRLLQGCSEAVVSDSGPKSRAERPRRRQSPEAPLVPRSPPCLLASLCVGSSRAWCFSASPCPVPLLIQTIKTDPL